IIVSSLQGLDYTAVLALVTYLCTVILVPQRSVVSLAFPILARAWKEKDMPKIVEVYRKSSINLLLLATFLFSLSWINFEDALNALGLPLLYLEGKPAFFFLALARIVELGTGVSGQIIITARKWKFELDSNIILLLLTIPINYILIKHYGLIGAGIASLISLTVFNAIRFLYLWQHYRLQPFTSKTLLAIAIPVVLVLAISYLIRTPSPWLNMVLRT